MGFSHVVKPVGGDMRKESNSVMKHEGQRENKRNRITEAFSDSWRLTC